MTCHSHPWGATYGLACIRTDVHAAGHIYLASDCPDAHDESEARATA